MVLGQDRAGESGGLGHCLDLGATCVTVALLLTLRGSLGSLNPESPDTPFSLCPGVPTHTPPNAQKFHWQRQGQTPLPEPTHCGSQFP